MYFDSRSSSLGRPTLDLNFTSFPESEWSNGDKRTREQYWDPGHLRIWDIWEERFWAVLYQLRQWEATADLHTADTESGAGKIYLISFNCNLCNLIFNKFSATWRQLLSRRHSTDPDSGIFIIWLIHPTLFLKISNVWQNACEGFIYKVVTIVIVSCLIWAHS